jgi:ribose/xylose/arabinose/galactoside ABC-type transport system permease subunit
MVIYFSVSSSNFLTLGNAINLSRQGAILLTLCLGVVVVKITGGMDLSNGAVMSLCGMIMAWALVNLNVPVYLAILISIIMGIILGTLNGFFVSILGIPSFIATLEPRDCVVCHWA